jgi:mRNA interferase RelE/StbE
MSGIDEVGGFRNGSGGLRIGTDFSLQSAVDYRTRFALPSKSHGGHAEVDQPDGYTTRFTATARRDLDKLPLRILAAVIEFAFGDVARQPRRVGKPLGRELAGQYSARRGPYRLL